MKKVNICSKFFSNAPKIVTMKVELSCWYYKTTIHLSFIEVSEVEARRPLSETSEEANQVTSGPHAVWQEDLRQQTVLRVRTWLLSNSFLFKKTVCLLFKVLWKKMRFTSVYRDHRPEIGKPPLIFFFTITPFIVHGVETGHWSRLSSTEFSAVPVLLLELPAWRKNTNCKWFI